MTKRHFIGSIVGSFIHLSENIANANFIFKTKQEVKSIPQSWIKLKGDEVLDYALFIQGLNLRNITPRMVLAPHFKSRRGVMNELPPKKMWKNIAPTLKAIDKICKETGISVKEILSAYRSPKYNRAVRGNRGSFHMQNQAIDLRFNNLSSWKASKVVKNYRDNKKIFKGGVGLYSSFIHIDTRGENQNW